MEALGGLLVIGLFIAFAIFLIRSFVAIVGAILAAGFFTAIIAGIAYAADDPMSSESIGATWVGLSILFIIFSFFGWLTGFNTNENENYNENSVESHNENSLSSDNDNSNHNNIVINNYIPGYQSGVNPHQMHVGQPEAMQLAMEQSNPELISMPDRGGVIESRNVETVKAKTRMTRMVEQPLSQIGKGVNWLKGLVQGVPGIPVKKGQEVVVGRSASSTIRIDNDYVSGQHVRLRLAQDGTIEVTDLGSTNGTYIDSRKLEPHKPYRLGSGNRLILGSEDVVYAVA
jgi:hypothetical protein